MRGRRPDRPDAARAARRRSGRERALWKEASRKQHRTRYSPSWGTPRKGRLDRGTSTVARLSGVVAGSAAFFRRRSRAPDLAVEVTLAFRCWIRPTVKAGDELRTALGVVRVQAVTRVDES